MRRPGCVLQVSGLAETSLAAATPRPGSRLRLRRCGLALACGCVAVAGLSPAAASLWPGSRLRLRRCGRAIACGCVAVASGGRGLRRGLDRSGGSRRGWVCGARLGSSLAAASLWLHVGSVFERASTGAGVSGQLGLRGAAGFITRCCVAVAARRVGLERASTGAGVSGQLGLRGAATILRLCGIHARCFLRVDRCSRRKNRGDEKGPVRAVILPLRGPSHAKEESLPTRRASRPLRTQDSAFAC